MFDPMLAAKDFGDWIQVIVVVLVVVGSAIGKIAQTIITHLNERHKERQGRGIGPDAVRPKPVASDHPLARPMPLGSDRPVARPMPDRSAQRPMVAPFGEGRRRDRSTTNLPPVSAGPDGLENALGEVLARLGMPQEPARRGQTFTPPPTGSSPRTPEEKRSRRTVVGRTMRAPMPGSPPPKRTKRPSPPIPQAATQPESASGSSAQRRRDDSSPSHAEEHLGHLRSEVEEREATMERAPDHLASLHPSLARDGGSATAKRGGGVRGLLGLQDRQAARRAILLSEVLGPPLSLRGPE